MGQDKQYLGIETLRFLCAVAVVVWHYQHFYMGLDEGYVVPFTREMQPLHALLKPFYGWGYMSVSLFWQISGFIFFWKYHEAIASGAVGGVKFFVLRFSRLYPLHVATLIAVAVLQPIFAAGHGGEPFVYGNDDLRHFVLGLFFASAWGLEAGWSFNGPVWSVSVEVLVYGLFFLVSSRLRLDLIGRLVAVAVAAVLLQGAQKGGFGSLALICQCAMFFFAGGAVHAGVRLISGARLAVVAPIALGLALVLAHFLFRNDVNTSRIVILGFSSLVLVGFLGLDGRAGVGRVFTVVAPLADVTYSSYLIHFPLQLAMVSVSDGLGLTRHVYDRPEVLIGFLALVFGLGWVVFHCFERPAQDLIRRLAGRSARPARG